jgi:Ca2+-binding RTX toxin-like protein
MKMYLTLIMLLCSMLANVEKINADPDPFQEILQGNDNNNKIILGYIHLGANGNGGDDDIVGNRRDNILNGGSGNDIIAAHDRDDIITPGKGEDKVRGGEGIDTVIYEDKLYKNTNIRTLNNNHIVDIDNEDVLVDIEFIQFADVKIKVETLKHN